MGTCPGHRQGARERQLWWIVRWAQYDSHWVGFGESGRALQGDGTGNVPKTVLLRVAPIWGHLAKCAGVEGRPHRGPRALRARWPAALTPYYVNPPPKGRPKTHLHHPPPPEPVLPNPHKARIPLIPIPPTPPDTAAPRAPRIPEPPQPQSQKTRLCHPKTRKYPLRPPLIGHTTTSPTQVWERATPRAVSTHPSTRTPVHIDKPPDLASHGHYYVVGLPTPKNGNFAVFRGVG